MTDVQLLAADTDVLIKENWPFPTAVLQNVAALCRALDMPLAIPELVFVEAREEWLRDTMESLGTAKEQIERLSRRTDGLINHAQVKWPSRAELEAKYDKAVNELIDKWKLRKIPLPSVTLTEAAIRAAAHKPPFKSADKNFRDGLIVWSLLQQVSSGAMLGFLARDNFYSETQVHKAAKSEQVTLLIFKTARDAFGVLETQFNNASLAKARERWQKANQRLRKAVEADFPRLEEYIRENLAIPQQSGTAQVLAFHELTLGSIESAQTVIPFDDPHNEAGSVSVLASIKVTQQFRGNAYRNPDRLRIGESVPGFIFPLPEPGPGPRRFYPYTDDVSGVVTVQLRINWPDGDAPPGIDFENLEFESDFHLRERQRSHQATSDMPSDESTKSGTSSRANLQPTQGDAQRESPTRASSDANDSRLLP